MASLSAQKINQTLFFEETLGRLSQLESLLTVDALPVDEWRNVIYRHCHTLKGSAASFGYLDFAASCHALENEFAALSSTAEVILIADYAPIKAHLAKLRERLNQLRQQSENEELGQTDSTPISLSQDLTLRGWQIYFKPNADFFDQGYDPLQVLRQLKALGPMTVTMNRDALPEFAELEPLQNYLSWQCELKVAVPESTLREIFDWIEPLCEYTLTKIKTQQPLAPPLQGLLSQQVNFLGAQIERQQHLIEQLKQATPQANIEWQELLLQQLAEVNVALRQDVQKLTMRPLSASFERLSTQVDLLSKTENKALQLHTVFDALNIDAQIVEKLSDILIQLIRNVVAHGIESADTRIKLGKPAAGQIRIQAHRNENYLRVVFTDDGSGIDTEKLRKVALQKGLIDHNDKPDQSALLQLIYHPGISTADSVSSLSGRGVGLDVVRQHMNSLYGRMQVGSTPGQGCEFILEIPLSQALLECQLCQVAEQTYAINLEAVISVFECADEAVYTLGGKGQFIAFQQQWLPLVVLAECFQLPRDRQATGWVLVLQEGDETVALWVSKVLDAGEYLVKPSQTHYHKVTGATGVVLLGQQRLALLLDTSYLIRRAAAPLLNALR